MAVRLRDHPAARLRRWGYHGAVGLIAALAVWSALEWQGKSADASRALTAARARAEEDRVAADGVAAECGLPAFSDEVALRTFPMKVHPYPTKQETVCLKKVTDARGSLINARLDLERAVPTAGETATLARRRMTVAAVLAAVFLAGVYLLEVQPLLRMPRRGPAA